MIREASTIMSRVAASQFLCPAASLESASTSPLGPVNCAATETKSSDCSSRAVLQPGTDGQPWAANPLHAQNLNLIREACDACAALHPRSSRKLHALHTKPSQAEARLTPRRVEQLMANGAAGAPGDLHAVVWGSRFGIRIQGSCLRCELNMCLV